jgi:hypothetical protein
MSQINTNAILDASGGTTTTINGFTPTVSNMAGRNRIINGDMRIDQRNAGASVTPTSTSYTLDRWRLTVTQASKFSAQQNQGSVTPPAGFTNYLGVTSQSAYSVGASDYFSLMQRIEGFNTADFGWGATGASTVTLSFWVRSSLTGTFGGALNNEAADRTYPFTYTINSANTWEQKTVTIAGDTSGTWAKTNGVGVGVYFSLGSGSTYTGAAGSWASANYWGGATGQTSVVGTSGATFYITGVQLEAGSVATPFEHRQYGQELALCQRYYYQSACALGSTSADYEWLYSLNTGSPYRRNSIRHPVTMRAAPTVGSITFRVNDASTISGSSQYITNAYWAASYYAASGTDYIAINGYTVTAEM